MDNKIILTKVNGFTLRKHPWDGGMSWIEGYYKDEAIAISLAEKEGGYKPLDNVEKVDNLYTDGDKIYILSLAGNGHFKDSEKEARDKIITDIKQKLTPTELALLGIK